MRRLETMRTFMLGVLIAGMGATMGCTYLPRASVRPIPTVASTTERSNSTLVVYLPGRWDRIGDFERRGMREEMTRAGVRADWIAVDAHMGYYLDRSVVDAVRDEVLKPARARGYRRIVVVGVSLGGLGALLCEREQAGLMDGLVLIAPYLGNSGEMFADIAREGGPAAWAASASSQDRSRSDVAGDVWSFIGTRQKTLPPIWLVWGEEDPLAIGHRLLAPLLLPSRVSRIEGGHNWTTWQVLWRDLCENSDLFTEEKRPETGTVGRLGATGG